MSNTQIVAYYDPHLKNYVMFTRGQHAGPRAAGDPKPEGRMHDVLTRRAVGRTESDDFRPFPLSDLHGKPLPGRTFDDATPVVGDQYRTPLKWKGGEDVGAGAGEPIMLRARLNRAQLFGLDFE